MANEVKDQSTPPPFDFGFTGEEVTVTAKRSNAMSDVNFNFEKMRSYNFLRSCRYALQILSTPDNLGYDQSMLSNFTFLTESVEFPGLSLNTVDYRMAGKNKIKIPSAKDYNEITLSFYVETEASSYELFSNWINLASPTSALNSYFDDLVGSMSLIQFADTSQNYYNNTSSSVQMEKGFQVNFENIFPINIASMPGSWADDQFQRLSVTFTYEKYYFSNSYRMTLQETINRQSNEYQYLADAGVPGF